MATLGILEIIKVVVEIGIIPALLILFIWYFFEKDKHREKQLDNVYESLKDRENILISASSQREELMRNEAAKMEKMLRTEAEKRENMLMVTIQRQGDTMEKISNTMGKIELSYVQILNKVENIEITLKTKNEEVA